MSIVIATTLLDLPTELLLCITKFLDFPSSVAFSHTNRSLRTILPIEPPTTRDRKLSFLLAVELWPKLVLPSRTSLAMTINLSSSH